MLQPAVDSQEFRGRWGGGTAAGTMGVPSLGCSAERVSLALRLVRVNVEGEEA